MIQHEYSVVERGGQGGEGVELGISYIIGGVNGKTVGFQENDVALRGR